jgi:hypothetical protein
MNNYSAILFTIKLSGQCKFWGIIIIINNINNNSERLLTTSPYSYIDQYKIIDKNIQIIE